MASTVDERQVFESMQSLQQRRGALDPDERRCLASEAIARGLEHPPADGRFRPWVHRIFTNLVLDRLRRMRTQRAAREAPPEPALTPEAHLLHVERVAALAQAIDALPPERRALLTQRFVQDRDCEAIARDLGVTPATVRTRVHRTLGELRRNLNNLGAFFPSFGPTMQLLPVASMLLITALPEPVLPNAPSLAMAGDAPVAAERTTNRRPDPIETLVPPAKLAPARRTHQPTRAEHDAPARPPAPPVAHYDFDDDAVTGDIQSPNDVRITAVAPLHHESMIEIPGSFVPALIKSLEDL